MSDIKLFRTENGQVDQLEGRSVSVEKSIQNLIERHLEAFLGSDRVPLLGAASVEPTRLWIGYLSATVENAPAGSKRREGFCAA